MEKSPKQILLVSATTLEAKLLCESILPGHQTVWNREEKFLYLTSPLNDEYILVLVVTGIGLKRAYDGLKQALSMFHNVDSVVGYGLAGGLIKTSKRGDLVLPKTVQTFDSKWIPLLPLKNFITPKNEPWNKLLSVEKIVSSPVEKAGVYAASGMEAVDMESASWARVCVESNINSWGIVRSVVDGGEDALPNMMSVVNGFGEVIPHKAALHFILHPGHISKAMNMTPKKLKDAMSSSVEIIQLFLFSKRKDQSHHTQRPTVISKVM
jgi:nucleoside phosphorylase